MEKRPPYPLQWAPGLPRTKDVDRRVSRFGDRRAVNGNITTYEGAKNVLTELARLGAGHVVITSELPTRHDGLPYADGKSRDPGVAVWFVFKGHERVFACDTWKTHGENLRAIALSIEAMRGLARLGMADVIERAFAGFAALPPGSGEAPTSSMNRAWWEVLDVASLRGLLADADLLAVVKTRHRALIKAAHPDAGGSHELAAELNTALAEAERALGGV